MIGQLMSVPGAIGTFVVALVIFGLAPGLLLALILRLLPRDDPRRRELHAELYAVPRWERPFWVCEQFEVALREGLFPDVSWWFNQTIWHRAKIESGAEMNRKYPDSFWVPSAEEKAELRPGDSVKLVWSIRRSPGERMWVTITHRDGDKLVGTLNSWAIFAFLAPDSLVKFHIDDIIDYTLLEEDEDSAAA